MVQEDDYLLTNQEILGGLKAALARGETLKDAMMTFYQSGYKKQEIEDAAKAYIYLQKGVSEINILKNNEQKKIEKAPKIEQNKVEKNSENEKTPKIKVDESLEVKETKVQEPEQKKILEIKKKEIKKLAEIEEPKTEQKVSAYPVKKVGNARTKAITVSLIIVLIALLGILGGVLLFKEELIEFFNKMFG